MSRLKKLEGFLSKLKIKKGGFKDKTGKVLTETEIEEAIENGEVLKGGTATNETCYVVQGDLLLIGDRATLEAKTGKEIGILKLDASTEAQLEAVVKVINAKYKKGVTGHTKGSVGAKTSASLGENVEVSSEVKGDAEVTAKAMVDLTRLMVNLGVSAKTSIQIDGHFKLDLKVVEIDAYVNASLSAEAAATAGISWKGVKAEAAASVEASVEAGAEVSTHSIKIKGHKFQLVFRPKITAYARAEAKAKAAAGLKTGVSVGAAAAVGLRGAIEAAIQGDYTTKGTDDFDREIKDGKSKAVANKKIKDLGVIGAEVDVELSVGTEFSVMPFDIKTSKIDGIEYGIGNGYIQVNVPSIALGPAGVGVGITINVNVLFEIVGDVIDEIKKIIRVFISSELKKALEKVYQKFLEEVTELAENVKEFSLGVVIDILDFIGQDLRAIDLELKRRDNIILRKNKKYILARSEFRKSKDKSPEAKLSLKKQKRALEAEFQTYTTYVESAFEVQKKNIEAFTTKTTERIVKLKEEGKHSEIQKIAKHAKSKTEKTIERMKELKMTKSMFEVYLKTSDLKLDPMIKKKVSNNIESMEETLIILETFLALFS